MKMKLFCLSEVELNDTHHSGLIHWAGGGSQLVICLTRDMVVRPGHPSSVYVSLDHGRSFTNISGNFTLEDGTPAVIGHSYEHPEFNNIVSTRSSWTLCMLLAA
ncbi:Sortilin-related receptor [Amphibalanus amphitrite]|uniref:Sortilin-related receptor n=1 Tax=Amphibalanus amphitrite TaxID=1232801 RepID=A0A6A4VNM3_AMPAM|nr:Sortilin-related receptor [Amphibalanus amphitrite]